MKVLFNPMITNQKIVKATKNSKAETPVENPIKSEETVNLNLYSGYISKVNFRAKTKILSATNKKLTAEIKNLQAQKESLLKVTVSDAVKDAKYKLERLRKFNDMDTWNTARANAKESAQKAKEKEQKNVSAIVRFFTNSGNKAYDKEYQRVMERDYHSVVRYMDDVRSKKSIYEEIINMADKDEVQRRQRISEIDEMIAIKTKMIDYQSLQDDINDMLSARGGVNDRIAGYEKEKEEINAKFIEPLLKSKNDPTVVLPSAVLLYGPTGTGKTTFLNGIIDQSRDVAHVVDLSSYKKSPSFDKLLGDELEKASQRYIDEGKRTIVVLNDAEDIFTITEDSAPLLGVTLDDQDRSIIRAAGDNTYERVSNFKQLLDTVSKTPQSGIEGGRHATTIFTTTNYPHLIHPDLLSREGKMTKMAVGVAEGHNLIDVLKFYFEKMEVVAESLRALKNKSDYETFVDNIAGISQQARENIKNLIKNGKIDNLAVDYNHMPYAKLAEMMGPNLKDGAYSNDGIRVICQEAFKDYLEQDPAEFDYRDSFFKAYKNAKRDLNPQRLRKFNLIDRMIQNEKTDIEGLESVLEQMKAGLLTKKLENLVKYYQNSNRIELESLIDREAKFGLTEEEKAKKEELLLIKKRIDDVLNDNVAETKTEDSDFGM